MRLSEVLVTELVNKGWCKHFPKVNENEIANKNTDKHDFHRLSENEGCLLSKCRVSFPREIYPFVLGQSRTPVPTSLYVIFAGCPYRNNSINPNLEAGNS